MALKKEINLPNGVKADYHRITNVNLNLEHKSMIILVSSYVEESYREEEKLHDINVVKYNELVEEIQSEVRKEEQDQTKIQELQTKIQEVTPVWKDNKVYSKNITLPLDTITFTHEDLYNKLKETEDFKDSEDAI